MWFPPTRPSSHYEFTVTFSKNMNLKTTALPPKVVPPKAILEQKWQKEEIEQSRGNIQTD